MVLIERATVALAPAIASLRNNAADHLTKRVPAGTTGPDTAPTGGSSPT